VTVSKQALSAFLNRELDDFSFLKEWRREDLLEELRALPVRPRITSPFKHWHHQLVALLLCCMFRGYLLYLDMGAGKTRIMLEVFAYWRRRGEAHTMLAVCLNDTNAYVWEDEGPIHAPQFQLKVLTGSAVQRWQDFEETDAHVYVISYAGLRTMCSKKKGKSLVLDPGKVKRLLKYVDFVAFDEIHKCKNPKSLTYKICKVLSRGCRFRYGSTGTAFGRYPEDLWAQFLLCDHGETLGSTLGLFREAYFTESHGFGGWKVWTFDKRTKPEFQAALRHRSIYYRDNEIGDMPKRVRRVIRIRPPESLQTYYNKALESLQVATRNEDLENNWVRLRMICSGFISYKDEDSDRIRIELPHNPKLEALESFVEQVPLDSKGIIVHEFIYSGLLIERHLEKLGHEFVCLNGSIKTKQKRKNYQQFRKEASPRFLIMNWRSGGTGGNYQISPHMHFYETPVSPIERKQTEGRIRRRDSKVKRVHYSDSIIKGSIEEDILGFLKEGRDLYADLMGWQSIAREIRKL